MIRHDNIDQRSPEWFELKLGKVSGTTLKGILGTKVARDTAFYKTIGELLKVPDENTPEYENDMDRGTRLESEAIAAYEFETGNSVYHTGFVEGDTPLSGQSPDGDTKATIGNVGVEVKCMGEGNHMKVVVTNKVPKEYMPQVLKYFMVDPTRVAVDFVAYNPEIPRFPLHIIRLYKVDLLKEIADAQEKENKFVAEVLEAMEDLIKE